MCIYKVTNFEVSQPRITKTERWKGHEDETRTGLEKRGQEDAQRNGSPTSDLGQSAAKTER